MARRGYMVAEQESIRTAPIGTGRLSEALAYASLFKPKVLGLLIFSSIISAVVAGGGSASAGRLLLLLLGGTLAGGGAGALNHYYDSDLDVVMARTRGRPLVTGLLRNPEVVRVLGIVLILSSIPAGLALGPSVLAYFLLGALIYIVIYTLGLKRRHWVNIVVGGLAGSCAVLGGWATTSPDITLQALLLATLMFLWTPSHFWSLAIAVVDDYRAADVPMLPVVIGVKKAAVCILINSVMMLLVSFALRATSRPLGAVYLAGALVMGGVLLLANTVLVQKPTQRMAWLNFKLSGIYLAILFLAMLLDTLF